MNVNNFGIRTAKTLSVAILALLALTAIPQSGRAQATADSPLATSSYVLAPSDQIEIFVQGHDEAHQQVQILPGGTFTYPNIDKPIKAAGMTVAKLTAFLTKNLSDYYNQPEVTVTVRENHIQKIKVAGIARSPGLYDSDRERQKRLRQPRQTRVQGFAEHGGRGSRVRSKHNLGNNDRL